MNIQKISTDKLNPAEYNPRKDLKPGDKEYDKLKRPITVLEFEEPLPSVTIPTASAFLETVTRKTDGVPTAAELYKCLAELCPLR